MIVLLWLLLLAAILVLSYYLASCFAEAAKDKGYGDRKYFWICFWLGFVGYLLVCALPDKHKAASAVPDELPDL